MKSDRDVGIDSSFRNHLAFLATHRGTLSAELSGVRLDGAVPFLSFFSPFGEGAELPAKCSAVWLYPWSGASWPERLGNSGFAEAEQLTYMRLARPLVRTSALGCTVECVRSRSAAIEFSTVQARGFLTDESDHRRWWSECFREMALRNVADPNQEFLLARVDGEAAAVLLIVRTNSTAGLYAVATVPEQRGKGLSTSLLHCAVERCYTSGSTEIVLQVSSGSYAHGFYQRLGFDDDYICQLWRK